jgi:hypothetical protein
MHVEFVDAIHEQDGRLGGELPCEPRTNLIVESRHDCASQRLPVERLAVQTARCGKYR